MPSSAHPSLVLARVAFRASIFAACWTSSCAPSADTKGASPTSSAASGGAGAKVADTKRDDATRDVRTAVVAERAWERTLRVTGELAAFDEATIATEVAGRLEELPIDVGTHVKRGDTLGVMERRDFELELERIVTEVHAARARLGLPADGADDTVVPERAPIVEQAQVSLADAIQRRDRLVEAAKVNAATQNETETAIAAVKLAEAHRRDTLEEIASRRALLAQRRSELAIAAKELEDTRIVAPFDGVVAVRRASQGDYLTVGSAIATLVRVDPVRVRLQIAEADVPRVAIGQGVTFTVTGDTTPWTTKIARVSPALDVRNRTLTVEADVPNPDGRLRPGSFVQASILLDADAKALSVPLGALTSFAGVDKVMSVVDGKAAERRVRLGRRDARDVEVLSGVVAGDVVVVEPGNLQTGTPVRVVTGN